MRRGAAAAMLVIGLWGTCAYAGCPYFRVSYRLLSCKALTEKEMAELDRSDQELPDPDLDEKPEGKLYRVRCSCDYTLSGSDPRCDFDMNDEQSSLIGAGEDEKPCTRGKKLCESVCARRRSD